MGLTGEVHTWDREELDRLIGGLAIPKIANVRFYANAIGSVNASYDYVNADGVVFGSGVSTNVDPETFTRSLS